MLAFWTWAGWNALVAIGTLALAGVTALLAGFTLKAVRESRDAIQLQARETKAVEAQTAALSEQTEAVREQARAAQRQANITASSVEAAARPVLVGATTDNVWRRVGAEQEELVPYTNTERRSVTIGAIHYQEADNDMIFCSVPLRNVGSGVAFIQSVELVTRTAYPGRVSNPVVPAHESTRARFAVTRRQSDGRVTDVEEVTAAGRGFAQFTVRVTYSGASADLITTTEVTVSQVPAGGFIFTSQQVWTGQGEDQQLLVSTENIA